ncbi:iron chelate uptake ABC transporter family permease subunit [Arthrobacter sp. zg-Y411]|uniref:FecCD family ABC transporter permease n=1 Tax=Arthrobacter zhangbolii TaxID=2886936 RepID=UPI001D15766C|nr:iron chelate uptake ABC transporter family permease subunit [Arthrobacter zhangbolii]MCC3294109.1 iron chelate uptake ABC transporter family permease subunit [Arthrobacter zhangbolii]
MQVPAETADPAAAGAGAPAAGRITPRGPVGPARGTVLLAAGTALLAAAVLTSLAVGAHQLGPAEVAASLWVELNGTGSSYADDVVASRIPRTVLGIMAGAALALAGVIMQGLTRNPLADPGILGINAGAAAAVVTGMAFFGVGATGANVWIALPGAVLTVLVVYGLASGRRGSSPVRLVLAGTVMSAVLMSYIQAIALTRPDVFSLYRFWAVGSLSGRTLEQARDILPFFLVGLVAALATGRSLNALALGEQAAASLGVRPQAAKITGALAATLLCASATAAVGPIGFVGLAVPHIVRSLTGPDHRWLLILSLLAGPSLLLFADVLGRLVARPGEVLTGVVTALLGAPLLILAVRRMRAVA